MSAAIEQIGDNITNPEEFTPFKSAASTEELEKFWQQKEKELQSQIADYESALEIEQFKNASLQKDLKERTEERDNLKLQLIKLEKQFAKNALQEPKKRNAAPNDAMTQAKSVIFEKVKVCKNQELQIEALTQQVQSLKEIAAISKDMLDIRNIEVNQLQDKLSCMELKFTAEKDHRALVHAKLEHMVKLNEDLKKEYQKQLSLFTELQNAYRKSQNLSKQNQESKSGGAE